MIVLDWVGGLCTISGGTVLGFSCFATAAPPLSISSAPPDPHYLRNSKWPIINTALVSKEILDYRAERLWRGERSDR